MNDSNRMTLFLPLISLNILVVTKNSIMMFSPSQNIKILKTSLELHCIFPMVQVATVIQIPVLVLSRGPSQAIPKAPTSGAGKLERQNFTIEETDIWAIIYVRFLKQLYHLLLGF